MSLAAADGGFPSWYQDSTGLALEFCSPQNAAEVAGGWCLLLPGSVGALPESIPANFFIEHFYFAGTAVMAHQGGGHSRLVLAQEASFANGQTTSPGDQTTFSRIRVLLNPVPVTGSYRFIHPYGEEERSAVAGDRIFFTNDVGLGCGLNFDCALRSRLGPFLLPSATPGGAEMPALTAANPTPDTNPVHFGGAFVPTAYPGTGKAYIADPARVGPVTGSPLPDFIDSNGVARNHNIFRIEGPAGSGLGLDPATGATVDWIETTDFSLMGRVFTGAMPGRIALERASYTRTPTAQKIDVFATAVSTTRGRLPAAPRPASLTPSLTFFDKPCVGALDPVTGTVLPPYSAPPGATETPMNASGALQWGRTEPVLIPSSVCVKDASAVNAAGVIVPVYMPQTVQDEVIVAPAYYDPRVGSLSVGAGSSDNLSPPTLRLVSGAFQGELVAGQIVVPGMVVPPAHVSVDSSALGNTRYEVSIGFAAAPVSVIPVAANDSFTFPMNSPTQILAVLANDSNVSGGTVTLISPPLRGTAVVNPDGSVSFTPTLNASGTDAFTYAVSVGTQVSNTGIATLNITPVNLAPTAVNDTVNALVNKALAINVLANDTDPNGATDVVAAVNLTQPAPAGAVASVAGGIVTFAATKSGTYTFAYKAKDAGGLVSANTATVTVQVAAAEAISFTKSQYVVSKSRLVVSGSISPIAGQTVRVDFVNTAGTVLGTAGTATSTTTGTWLLDVVGIALPAGTVSVKATTSNGTVLATGLALK